MESCLRPGDRLGRFATEDGREFIGIVRGDSVIEADERTLAEVMRDGLSLSGGSHEASGLKTLCPVERPSKIICIGLNYRSHIREMGWEAPQAPIIFTKPSSALIGPDESILLPDTSSRVDFEGESAIVLGSRARNVGDGAKHIFGYTCFNDVTARDLQKTDPDWTRAKGFDTFAPIGPYLSFRPPSQVITRLNGRTVQSSPLSDRVFGDAALVEYISTIMTLEPGDIIATGTPSGIAPMSPGDLVEVELDGVGVLRSKVERRSEARGEI